MTDQKPLKCQEGTVYISDLNNAHNVIVEKNGALHHVGQYKELNEAREVQKECYKHLKNKTFEKWKANRQRRNKRFDEKLELFVEYCSKFGDVPSSSQQHPTIYKDVNLSVWWIGQKAQFRAGNMKEWQYEAFREQGIHLEEYTKTSKIEEKERSETEGVCYSKTEHKWQAFFVENGDIYWLGSSTSYRKMAELRKEAEKHADDFLQWYKTSKTSKTSSEKRRVNPISKTRGVTYSKPTKKWRAVYYFEKKTYALGSYEEMEDAMRVRKEAEKHADDFLQWYSKWREERSRVQRSEKDAKRGGEIISKKGNTRIRKVTLYQVEVIEGEETYCVSKVQNLQKAKKIQAEYCGCNIEEIDQSKSKKGEKE